MPRFDTHSGLYGWDAPERRIKEVRKQCLILTGISLILSLGCGLLPTGVARHNWVGFAGTAALVAVLLEIVAVGRFCSAKSQLDYRSFHSIHWMMDYAPLMHIMLMGVAFAAGIISCIQGFTGVMDILCLAGFLLSGAASLMLRKAYRTIPVYKMDETGY